MQPPQSDLPKDDNSITLQSYQHNTQAYIDVIPPLDGAFKAWIDDSLSLIPKHGKILEIGSGAGRDAAYIKDQGFDIECSDAVPNFVQILQQKGLKTRTLNVLTDSIDATYDMVLAVAVLLHFSPEETTGIVKKIHAALNEKGIFALRVKKGDGAAWINDKLGEPRYFYYWQPKALEALLAGCGFTVLRTSVTPSSFNDTVWIGIIAQKSS